MEVQGKHRAVVGNYGHQIVKLIFTQSNLASQEEFATNSQTVKTQ
jgi:hypothetical protein